VRTLADVATSLHLATASGGTITRQQFQWALDEWRRRDLGLPGDDETLWQEFDDLRGPYDGNLERLIEHLDAPRGFWGHRVGRLGTGLGARVEAGRDPIAAAGHPDPDDPDDATSGAPEDP
jgi:hypothetical protein